MSEWCRSHPTYSAKREPNSLCGDCWRSYFYRCPERKPPEDRPGLPSQATSKPVEKGEET